MSISPTELSDLIDAHWNPLLSWVGTTADAEDIVQQTFVALAGLAKKPDNPKAWLYTVAKNRAINAHKQSKRRTQRHKLASKSEQVHAAVNSPAEMEELKQMLQQLTPEQREVVSARVWGELTFEQIAKLQATSRATVWRTFQTAIAKLRIAYGITHEVNQ